MIQMQSNLDVADNSGAKRVQCIKVLGGSKRRFATVGDIIVVSIKEAAPRGKVKKGDVHRAVIVRTAKDIHRADGSTIRFDGNAAVLVNKNEEPIGTRIFGPVVRELRARNHMKIICARARGAVMSALKIKKGDKVVVLSGKDKGKTGEVTKAFPKDGKVDRRPASTSRRATARRRQANPQGGLDRFEAPLHVSKVAIATADGKPTRVRFETQDGKKVRVAVKTGEKIDG